MTDCIQYEKDYVIKTQTVHNVPQVWHAASTVAQRRIKAYNSHSVMVTDDSYSSDNTAAGDLVIFFFFMLDFVYSSCSENALSLDALVLCLMIMMMMILERNGDGSHF